MVSSRVHESQRVSGDKATVGRLFLLDLSDDCVVSLNRDGSDRKVIVTECRYTDDIVVDVATGQYTAACDPAVHTAGTRALAKFSATAQYQYGQRAPPPRR